MKLKDKATIVTGAASGIGRATALSLATTGVDVIAVDVDAAGLRSLAADGGATVASIETVIVDLADAAAVASALEPVVARRGPIGGLVNAAGIGGDGPFLDVDPVAWDRVLAVHLGGTVACSRAVLPGMLAAGRGRIVNVLTDGLWHGRTTVPYTTAKGAILGFTRSLAIEVAPKGVRVNAVAPGPVDTPMFRTGDAIVIAAELGTVPIGRVLEPAEIAATIGFLLGPGGEPYVGQVLSPNGGTVLAG